MFAASKSFLICLLVNFLLAAVLANVEGIDTAAAAHLDSSTRSLGVGPSELGKTRARRVRGVLKGAALGAIAGGAGAAIMKQGK
uniref:Uncharacterized protein n=1 Tax=Ditylenchus dipsaci TaxID=166011 RepID=A0A915E850_9BILA